jgi:hypothetical protein
MRVIAGVLVAGLAACTPPTDAPAPEPAAAADAPADRPAPVAVEPLPELPPRPPPLAIAPPDPARAGTCPRRGAADVGLLVSPVVPAAGRRATVLAATLESRGVLALRVESDRGEAIPVHTVHRAGVPTTVEATFEPPRGGTYRVIVGAGGEGLRCAKVWVAGRASRPQPPEPDLTRVWEVRRNWDAAEEALYSAWVRRLFAAPPGEDLAFEALDRLTSDPERNLLHDHLGWGEDQRAGGLALRPDCADTPYFLRGYFAWKRALPFGFRTCSRGMGEPPRCFDLRTVDAPPELKPSWIDQTEPFDQLRLVERFFRRTLAWGVHTGNGRTAHGDSNGDLYPVRLDRRGLRPGIVYADPYGHIFVLVDLVDQQGGYPGILYAIDGQPDGSITRKRFWEGNFLWNQDPALGGSGFKAFRPLVRITDEQGLLRLVALDDAALGRHRGYGDVSNEQAYLRAEEFYDRVEDLVSPAPRDPFVAQLETVLALAEAARVRVTSIDNGVRWHAEHASEVIEMPWGHAVFETVGAWENFSTPARDLRLLIAMDVVEGFAGEVRRRPAAFGLGPERIDETLARLERSRADLLARPELGIRYHRSDGSEVALTLAQLFERRPAFEVGYNPNDCPEVRWGAPEGSDELATCDRRAPAEQQQMMSAYRQWFARRERPGRGDPGPDVPGLERPAPTDGDETGP